MSKSPMAKGEFHTVEFSGVIWTKQIAKKKKKLIFRINKTKKKKKRKNGTDVLRPCDKQVSNG